MTLQLKEFKMQAVTSYTAIITPLKRCIIANVVRHFRLKGADMENKECDICQHLCEFYTTLSDGQIVKK